MKRLKVAVLMGGNSSERDISLISGRAVIKGLSKSMRFEIRTYNPANDLIKLARDKTKIDVVFPVLHGKGGEDGAIQGYLELLGLPYVGSGVLASALAMDKKMAQIIYKESGILVCKKVVINKSAWSKNYSQVLQNIRIAVGLPCVVKPNNQGSSVGVSIVKKENQLKNALREAFGFDPEVLIEEFMDGVEVTCPVLGNEYPEFLPVIEIIPPKGRFFDRKAKYNGETQEIVPARLSEKLTKETQDLAIKAHQALGCRGFSRTDMIIAKTPLDRTRGRQNKKHQSAKIYVLETNTIPGMTAESLFPKSAKAAGINFSQLLDRLIELALEKNSKNSG